MKAVVIGSGFGGLAVALRLLAKGYDVTILEAREKVGGRAYQLQAEGFVFDMGPSLVTAPSLFDELFDLFGKSSKDSFELVPLDPFYRIYYQERSGGFRQIDYNGNPEQMVLEMEKLEPGGGVGYQRYFEATRPIFEAAYLKYGSSAFMSLGSFLAIVPQMVKLGALNSMAGFAAKFFKTDFARRTFSFHPLYIGTNPYDAPAALGFIPWLEREQGVWFARGGMYQIVKGLEQLFVQEGGKVRCGEQVLSMEVNQQNEINKVVTSKGSYEVDLVVSNADVLKTYQMLDTKIPGVASRQKALSKKTYSMSLLMLYFGLNKQYHQKLRHHTLILGVEYKKLLDEIFKQKVLPSTLSMYLHIPTITDQSMAPEGGESMYILVPVPNLSGSLGWTEQIEKSLRDKVVRYLEYEFGLEGFANSIVYEKRMNPIDFRDDLQSSYGAAFATQLSLLQSVYFRQHNKAKEVKKLYFVGAGTHPGPGVPGVLLTAKATSELIPDVK